MRPQKVNNTELVKGLLNVFRSKGYDGASLNDLAVASGLQKASLYHRFPNGKKEIAAAVLKYVNEGIHEGIYEVLTNTSVSVNNRLTKVLANINVFYEEGEANCILRSMTLDSGIKLFKNDIKDGMEKWINAFTFLGKEVGFNDTKAMQEARETLIIIQGSLLVSKALGNLTPFKEALSKIENIYKQ